MNHETLKALYQLDVDEVGEEEAAKRWKFLDAMHSSFQQCIKAPGWGEFIQYRRKPDLPWPKVIQPDLAAYKSEINRLQARLNREQPATQWPDDAPEWANYMATDSNGQVWLYETKPVLKRVYWLQGEVVGKSDPYNNAVPNWRDTLIERPKPAKQKCKCCGQEVE